MYITMDHETTDNCPKKGEIEKESKARRRERSGESNSKKHL
jgi:hypothetical protein